MEACLLETKDGYLREEVATEMTKTYIFQVVYQAWRKVQLYEELGETDIAQAQRLVLHDRAQWVAKQRERARGWRVQVE